MVEAVVQNLRGATLMQDGEYHYVRRVHSKINSIGATVDKNSPQLPIDQGVSFGAQLDPLKFLTRPGLWLGLLFAAACLAAAVRLRRNREPI